MYQVTFQFEDQSQPIRISAAPHQTILEAAKAAGIALDAPCAGNGTCGKCRVKLLEGSVEAEPGRHISPADYESGWRLGCSSRVSGDVTVWIPRQGSDYRAGMQLAEDPAPRMQAKPDCGFLQYRVTTEKPSAEALEPDSERLLRQVRTVCKTDAALSFDALRALPKALREGDFTVTVSGFSENGVYTVMDVSAQENPMFACAVDIGTTTVAGVLLDLKTGKIAARVSAGNAQIPYGADVINRIVEQGRPGGIQKMQDAILTETLMPLVRNLCEMAHTKPCRILRTAIAANTTMNHLLLGLDAEAIRTEPYVPAFFQWDGLTAGELGFPANSRAKVLLAPNIGSYVGGDITAGTYVSGIWEREEYSLFVDLGTNGELVFGNREFLLSCACSAGPAFEGGEISCGMRATKGAIEAVTIEKDTLLPTFTVIGGEGQKPAGLCGSGILDVVAELYRTGAISPKGRFQRKSPRIVYDENGMGSFLLAFREESAQGREISVTEVDIEAVIRAKAAVFAAIRTMLRSVDMDASVLSHIYVAGGIGSGINMENAVAIGMLPDVDRSAFSYVGNTALAGACAMAVSDEAAGKIYEVARSMTYLELSSCPGYMDEFVAACFLPHTDRSLFT